MQYLRGWTAMRNDPQWVGKVGWATLFLLSSMCIPVLGQLVLLGWTALMLRRAVSGQDSPLPRMEADLDYLGKLLQTGFKGFLASVLWSIPLVGAVMSGYCCIYLGILGVAGGAVAGEEVGGEVGAGIGLAVGGVLMLLAVGLLFALILVANMVLQVAVMRAELTDDVNAAMRFRDVMNMTKLLRRELFVGVLVMSLVGMLVGLVGVLSLYLLLFPGIVVMMIVTAYFRAELYRVYLEKGGEPLLIGPLQVEGGDPPSVGPQSTHPQPAGF